MTCLPAWLQVGKNFHDEWIDKKTTLNADDFIIFIRAQAFMKALLLAAKLWAQNIKIKNSAALMKGLGSVLPDKW